MEKRIYQVTFKHYRYTGEGQFFYWIQRPTIEAAKKAAENLYQKDELQSGGARVIAVELVGTLDA